MNKVAVVTAASRGIGAATARAFGRAGYDVVVNYHSHKQAADEVVADIKAAGSNAFAVKADVFTAAGVEMLFEAIKKHYKQINIFINNAGLPEEPTFGRYTFDVVQKSLTGNVASAVMCSQAAVPLLVQGGSLLFTSSIYGLQNGGKPSLMLYSAGKAAIISLAQTLAEQLAPDVRCNVVAPGFTKTPAWDGVTADYAAKHLNSTLQKEWVEAEDIASAFLFLADTPHINATTIVVDGGWIKKSVGIPPIKR